MIQMSWLQRMKVSDTGAYAEGVPLCKYVLVSVAEATQNVSPNPLGVNTTTYILWLLMEITKPYSI
ncbi:hypothetical protein GCM10011585_32390 [Edaphobacter dinghuensis]|uniref:Uncharacterized protein n=1 Tax=Edaphobacter dinghuensis TaxID=1560005 RepID=A0A917M9E5_9BACT|nr:hypothetical protein GCM10011585_32390 [Edaphobacter dinghuensis]